MFEYIAALSGLIATFWISTGVYVVAKLYPNYSHTEQFCSELGATGSATQKISPLLNNYPLSILFCIFSWYICNLNDANWALLAAGFLVMLHGIGTAIAGYFPMDKDPYTITPSNACKIHSWAGFVMLLSLLIAPLLIAFSPESEMIGWYFRLASIFTVIFAVYYLQKMAKAFKAKQNVGLYQRIAYWIKLLWLSLLSILLFNYI